MGTNPSKENANAGPSSGSNVHRSVSLRSSLKNKDQADTSNRNQGADPFITPRSLNTVRFTDDDGQTGDIDTHRTVHERDTPSTTPPPPQARTQPNGHRPWAYRPPPPSTRPDRPRSGDGVPSHTNPSVPVAHMPPMQDTERVVADGTPAVGTRAQEPAVPRMSDLPPPTDRPGSGDRDNDPHRKPVPRPPRLRDGQDPDPAVPANRAPPGNGPNPNGWLIHVKQSDTLDPGEKRGRDTPINKPVRRTNSFNGVSRLQYRPGLKQGESRMRNVFNDDNLQNCTVDSLLSPRVLIQETTSRLNKVEDGDCVDANLRFYRNEIKSRPNGEYIGTIHKHWFGDFERLENDHAFIQWLFPLPERSSFNQHSVPLKSHEAIHICKDPKTRARVIMSYRLMLDFYGILLVDEKSGHVKRSALYKERFHALKTSQHNHLRITRIIKSLGHLGFPGYQAPLVMFLLHEIFETRRLSGISQGSIQHWLRAIENSTERDFVIKGFKQWLDSDYSENRSTRYTSQTGNVMVPRPAVRDTRLLLK